MKASTSIIKRSVYKQQTSHENWMAQNIQLTHTRIDGLYLYIIRY